jgi:hypothetical protein
MGEGEVANELKHPPAYAVGSPGRFVVDIFPPRSQVLLCFRILQSHQQPIDAGDEPLPRKLSGG